MVPHTCRLAGQPNSCEMGRMATLMQMRSMLHTSRARAVGSTTRAILATSLPAHRGRIGSGWAGIVRGYREYLLGV